MERIPPQKMKLLVRSDILENLAKFATEIDLPCESTMDKILYRFLKMGDITTLSEYILRGTHTTLSIARMTLVTPDVVRDAKEEIKKLASLKLNEEELKERYAEIDKLAKF